MRAFAPLLGHVKASGWNCPGRREIEGANPCLLRKPRLYRSSAKLSSYWEVCLCFGANKLEALPLLWGEQGYGSYRWAREEYPSEIVRLRQATQMADRVIMIGIHFYTIKAHALVDFFTESTSADPSARHIPICGTYMWTDCPPRVEAGLA